MNTLSEVNKLNSVLGCLGLLDLNGGVGFRWQLDEILRVDTRTCMFLAGTRSGVRRPLLPV